MIDPSSGMEWTYMPKRNCSKAMDFNISNSGLMPVAGDRTGKRFDFPDEMDAFLVGWKRSAMVAWNRSLASCLNYNRMRFFEADSWLAEEIFDCGVEFMCGKCLICARETDKTLSSATA
jgi:hypothetical protein